MCMATSYNQAMTTCVADTLAEMTAAEFEAFAAWCSTKAAEFTTKMAKTMRTERNTRRHTARDRLGRFVRVVPAASVEVWVNDSNGNSHAHTKCGDLRGTTWTTGPHMAGWMCVSVEVSARVASHNVATVSGTRECDCCGETKRMRSFPTVVLAGWRLRGDWCAKCTPGGRLTRSVWAA